MSTLFSSGPDVNIEFGGFSGGGLSAPGTEGPVNITASQERQDVVGGLSKSFQTTGKQLTGLLPLVTPGSGQLTKNIENLFKAENEIIQAKQQARESNLAADLASRGVLGSSFGQNLLTSTSLTFTKELEKQRAEAQKALGTTFLAEFQLKENTIRAAGEAFSQSFNVQLKDLNFQAELAANLANTMTQALAAGQQTESKLELATLQEQLGVIGGLTGFGAAGGFKNLFPTGNQPAAFQ